MAHEGFHEAEALLRPETMDKHRALVSLQEELEAVDWYDQRVDAATDDALRAVLAHNRDEEKEHAAMTLEWLRRNDAKWDDVLRTYLFTTAPITEVEHAAESGGGGGGGGRPSGPVTDHVVIPTPISLGIGSLRGEGL
jgi:ferritin-like protein